MFKQSAVLAALLGLSSCSQVETQDLEQAFNYSFELSPEYKSFLERRESKTLDPDAYKNMEEIGNEHGFAVESYNVVTKDGYVLRVYRIPGTLAEVNQPKASNKPVVLLQHGLGADMMQWVYNDAEVAQAFVLARKGYDVWMGNNRGTRYSQNHLTMNINQKEFWDFDWEQMGTFDAPAILDFITEKTGQQQVTWVGHSEGTSQLMAGASLMPDYFKSKVKVAIFLAPPAAMKNCPNSFLQLVSKPLVRKMILGVVNTTHLWDTLPHNKFESSAAVALCKLFNGHFCDMIVSAFSDTDISVDNTSRYDVYMTNFPAGGGWRNQWHYFQNIALDTPAFQRYDFGAIKNKELYGTSQPPEYDLSLVDIPIAIFSGDLDKLADPKDVAWTADRLQHTLIYNHQYHLGHMSFAVAKDMSYWTVDAMAIINHYNDVCDPETVNSRFTAGNEKCQ